MSQDLVTLLTPLVFSGVVAAIGGAARAVDPRRTRRRRLQAAFDATKDLPGSMAHEAADRLLADYLDQEADNSDTYVAAGWARNANIMWVFAGSFMVATIGIGYTASVEDVDNTVLTANLKTMFESSALGAVFTLSLGCAALGVVFALISWASNRWGRRHADGQSGRDSEPRATAGADTGLAVEATRAPGAPAREGGDVIADPLPSDGGRTGSR